VLRGLHFPLFLKSDTTLDKWRWIGSETDTLVTNSETSEVGCSSKRKLPSLDLTLTSLIRDEKGPEQKGECLP
jgi:hypothetical protein